MRSDADWMKWWADFKSDPGFKIPMDKIRSWGAQKDIRDFLIERQEQKEAMNRDLDKDVRDWSTRPSASEFMEPPRGGPSSYMRSMGKFGEMLYELLGMAGPAKTGLFSKVIKRRRLKESDKIDPTEYGKWSDEVSKNAPDPRPEDLMGHTRPEKHRLLGKRWFDRGR